MAQSLFANDNFVVIVSQKAKINSISKQTISKIFLSKTKILPNGQRAIAVELNKNKYKESFYKKITGKSLKQLKRYWATMIFTGKGRPPKKMKTSQEIIDFVKDNENSIAYLPSQDVTTDGVKVVLELD